MAHEKLLLPCAEQKFLVRVHPREMRGSMIYVVVSLTQIEINDVYRINFANFYVLFADVDVFGYGLAYPKKHALEVINFAVVLQFDDNKLLLGILCQDIHPVELFHLALLIALAFEDTVDFDVLVQQFAQESFKNAEVGFVAQYAFHCPVK